MPHGCKGVAGVGRCMSVIGGVRLKNFFLEFWRLFSMFFVLQLFFCSSILLGSGMVAVCFLLIAT